MNWDAVVLVVVGVPVVGAILYGVYHYHRGWPWDDED